jgi:hypothetical protein
MSTEITTSLVKQFHDNFDTLCQQKTSKFEDCVRTEPINAEDGFYDQIGASDGADITTRHADTQHANTPHARRKVTPVPWQWSDLIDRADKVRMLGDPQNSYLMAGFYSLNRRKDKHVIDAMFGTAYTGKTGGTAVPFPADAAHVVPVSFGSSTGALDVGLNVPKLARAKRLFMDLDVDVDEEEIFIAVNGKTLEDLLNSTEATSSDYAAVKALVKGDINTFMGFTFKKYNKLPTDSNGDIRVPVWCKSGLLLAVADEKTTEIDKLPTKNYSVQVYVGADMGATRMEETKVIEIKCDPVVIKA